MHLLWPGGEGALESLLCAIWFSRPRQGPGAAAEMRPLFWCQQRCPHGVSGASYAQILVRAPSPSPPEPSSGSLSFLHLSTPSDVLCPSARGLMQKQLGHLHHAPVVPMSSPSQRRAPAVPACPPFPLPFAPLLGPDSFDFFLLLREHEVFDSCLCHYSSLNAVVVLCYCQIAAY